MYITLGHKYETAQYKWLRTCVFTLSGATGTIPLLHHVYRYGLTMSVKSYSFEYLLVMWSLYLIGVVFYMMRIPERWIPTKFDIIGSSHQIWHLFVYSAVIANYVGIYQMYHWWHTNNAHCVHSDQKMISWFQRP